MSDNTDIKYGHSELSLLYQTDLDKLTFILAKLCKVAKSVHQDDRKLFDKLLVELDGFYSIHSTRTRDVLVLLERLEKAKNEYTKVRAYSKEVKELNDKQSVYIAELLAK